MSSTPSRDKPKPLLRNPCTPWKRIFDDNINSMITKKDSDLIPNTRTIHTRQKVGSEIIKTAVLVDENTTNKEFNSLQTHCTVSGCDLSGNGNEDYSGTPSHELDAEIGLFLSLQLDASLDIARCVDKEHKIVEEYQTNEELLRTHNVGFDLEGGGDRAGIKYNDPGPPQNTTDCAMGDQLTIDPQIDVGAGGDWLVPNANRKSYPNPNVKRIETTSDTQFTTSSSEDSISDPKEEQPVSNSDRLSHEKCHSTSYHATDSHEGSILDADGLVLEKPVTKEIFSLQNEQSDHSMGVAIDLDGTNESSPRLTFDTCTTQCDPTLSGYFESQRDDGQAVVRHRRCQKQSSRSTMSRGVHGVRSVTSDSDSKERVLNNEIIIHKDNNRFEKIDSAIVVQTRDGNVSISKDEKTSGLTSESRSLSSEDLSRSSIECLLEQLIQRGTVEKAFVMDLDGKILAHSQNVSILNKDARGFYDCLRGHYNGLMRIEALEMVFTCFMSTDGTMLMGTSNDWVCVSREGTNAIVVGFGQKPISGSRIAEMTELSRVLSGRGL